MYCRRIRQNHICCGNGEEKGIKIQHLVDVMMCNDKNPKFKVSWKYQNADYSVETPSAPAIPVPSGERTFNDKKKHGRRMLAEIRVHVLYKVKQET